MAATPAPPRPVPDRSALLALLAAAVTVVLWASAFVAIRHVGRELSPGALSLGRLPVGSIVLGSAVAFGGVVVIGAATSGRSTGTAGVVLCIVAAAAYAIGVVAQKPLLSRLPALEVTWLACAIGTVACLPFGPTLVREAADARVSTLAWVVYLGAFPTAIAFTTWAYALSRTSAGRMGATTYLVPPVTIVLAWGLLGETPALLAVAAAGSA